ncbi:MAG: thiO [Chloroflexi bacterium]|nr:thiO [Chloroflexota bacterium]
MIGCAIAHGLARRGARVTVIERTGVAAEASGAAAGILAPRVYNADEPVFALALASDPLFGPLLDDLRAATDLDTQYVRSGVLDLAFVETDAKRLQDKQSRLLGHGHDVRWLSARETIEIEPEVSEGVLGAFYDADAHHIHPERFTRALAQAAARRGARFQLGVDAIGLTGEGGRATAVRTSTGNVAAGHVIIATGSWSTFSEDWIKAPVPIYPAKGQILTVAALPSPIRHILNQHSLHGGGGGQAVDGLRGGRGIYLVPRVDGTVVVGATIERVGYDRALTASALAWLLGSIPSLVPSLRDARFDRAWTGLRPATPDELPIVGRAPGWENVTLATGHYRSGIMLAPITAALVTRLILDGERDPLLDALDPARFSHGGGARQSSETAVQ